ncbi:MAG: S-layer homology domain-containing protein [bacterium]|nr:S-layer homology domain-containing protein [bacterium]
MDIHLLKQFKYNNGKGCRMWLGDINGDGIMEIVMVQPDTGFDDRFYPHSVVCAAAYNLNGEKLWQIGEPDPNVAGSGSDIPAQIYDIDNDGNNEFICVMNGELCFFDGKTGELKEKHSLPDKHAHDCIVIADLEGTGYPQNIILKDRYKRLWALDTNFEVMWTFTGNIGHYPWVYDLNGDGKDEIIAGYNVLNSKGELLWTIDMDDHADCIWVCDLKQDKQPVVLVGGSDTTAYSADGKLLWRFTDTVESQNIAPGNFIPENKGTEIAGLDRISRNDVIGADGKIIPAPDGKDGVFVFDCNAKSIFKEDRQVAGWKTIVTTIHNFDRGAQDYILAYRRSDTAGGVYDAKMNPIFEFPFDGHIMWTDLTGDGLSQILLYDDEKIAIFSTEKTDLSKAAVPYTRPQPKRLYNWTRYWGSEMNPSQYAVNYITGDFTTNDISAWAHKCALERVDNSLVTRADFIVLLVNALNLKAYERSNFNDILPRDYYYEAAGIAKKLNIVTGDTFNPDKPITAGEATEMLKKVNIALSINLPTGTVFTKWQVAKIFSAILNR